MFQMNTLKHDNQQIIYNKWIKEDCFLVVTLKSKEKFINCSTSSVSLIVVAFEGQIVISAFISPIKHKLMQLLYYLTKLCSSFLDHDKEGTFDDKFTKFPVRLAPMIETCIIHDVA